MTEPAKRGPGRPPKERPMGFASANPENHPRQPEKPCSECFPDGWGSDDVYSLGCLHGTYLQRPAE